MELSQTGWRRLSFVLLAATTAATVGVIVLRPIVAVIATSEGAADLLPSTFDPAQFAGIRPIDVMSLPFAFAAHLILRRVPNRVGLVLHGIALAFVSSALGIYFGILHRVRWRLGLVGDLVEVWVGYLWLPALVLLFVVLPLLFPTGHAPSPRWRWVAWGGAGVLIGGFVSITQQTVVGTEPMTGPLWLGLAALLLVSVVGGLVSVVVRYRRAHITERQQVKWVAFTLVVAGAITSLSLLWGQPLALPLLLLIVALSFVSIPVSIAMAIARYRLYEIDRIISRTVAYTLVAATVAIVYAVPVLLIPDLIDQSSDLVVAVSTLAAAAVFNPVRRRAQRFVDRRFNRARFDAVQELEAFATGLSAEVDLDSIASRLIPVVNRTMQPDLVAVWIKERPLRPGKAGGLEAGGASPAGKPR